MGLADEAFLTLGSQAWTITLSACSARCPAWLELQKTLAILQLGAIPKVRIALLKV